MGAEGITWQIDHMNIDKLVWWSATKALYPVPPHFAPHVMMKR